MNISIEIIYVARQNFLKLMSELSVDELNKIPAGFNNNMIWNFGHIIVSQQIICYKLSHLPLKIDEAYISKYQKGTKPGSFIDENEYALLKEKSVKLIYNLDDDLEDGLFKNFTPYTTSFGVSLNTIDDAVIYIAMHEGFHLGYAMALKRTIN